MAKVTLTVNGATKSLDIPPDTPLLWALRDTLGLTGTKFGCGAAQCGACTVHLQGAPIRSCQIPVSAAQGAAITTIEGLSPDTSHPVQRAWLAEQVPQCGYCQSGQIMSAAALLARTPQPTDEQIDRAMSGNFSARHPPSKCTSFRAAKRRAVQASRVCRPSRRPWPTRPLPRRDSACGRCPSQRTVSNHPDVRSALVRAVRTAPRQSVPGHVPRQRPGDMRRFHLLEIEDQPWCPKDVRDGATDYLQFMSDAGRVYGPAAPILAAALSRSAATSVVDLAGGAGGAWRSLLPALAEHGVAPSVQLTDRYPNAAAFARIERDTHGAVVGYPRSVDATAVRPELSGFRTMFAALHHFRPAEVRTVVRDATARGEGFAAFEPMHRDLRAMLLTCVTPLMVLLVTPMLRPFRWSRLFWTYLLPAIPLVVLVDGIVSCLRTYTPAELRALAGEADAVGYQWDAGEVGSGPIPVTYLVGLPPVTPS